MTFLWTRSRYRRKTVDFWSMRAIEIYVGLTPGAPLVGGGGAVDFLLLHAG